MIPIFDTDLIKEKILADQKEIVKADTIETGQKELERVPIKQDRIKPKTVVLVFERKDDEPLRLEVDRDVKKLELEDKKIKTIPAEIGELTDLTELNLRGYQLTQLPSEIGKLTNLTELDLRGNKLTRLPSEIGNLTK